MIHSSHSFYNFPSKNLFDICTIFVVIVVLVFCANFQLTDCVYWAKPHKIPHKPAKLIRLFKHADNEENEYSVNYSSHLFENLVKDDYNKNIRPGFGGPPETIQVSILISDISTIADNEMEFEVDFYLRHIWFDPRLAFEMKHNLTSLTLTEGFLRKIWMPDTFLVNGKKVKRHNTIRSDKATLLRVNYDGHVLYSTRMVAILQCPMNLALFPFDQQRCAVTMGSYEYTTSQMQFKWLPDNISLQDIDLPSFRILGFDYEESFAIFLTGNYTRIFRYIILERDSSYYLSQVYMPSFLIVVISWLPFWLDRNDHLGRVALGITTVLTIITLITNANANYEKISYLKALDIYLFVCFIMVFFSLIEFATVGYYETILMIKKEEKRKLRKKWNHALLVNAEKMKSNSDYPTCRNRIQKNTSRRVIASNKKMHETNLVYTHHCDCHSASALSRTSIIDHWARWLFPISFILFNIFYIGLIKFLTENFSLSASYKNITANN